MSSNLAERYERAREELFSRLEIEVPRWRNYRIFNLTSVYWLIEIPTDKRENTKFRCFDPESGFKRLRLIKNDVSQFWRKNGYAILHNVEAISMTKEHDIFIFDEDKEVDTFQELQRISEKGEARCS